MGDFFAEGTHEVPLVGAGTATLEWRYKHTLTELRLFAGGREWTADGTDVVSALFTLRQALEAEGLLIAVQGARRDAQTSGMLRDMAVGAEIYLITGEPGPPATVETLAPAEPGQAATLAHQREFGEQLRGRPGAKDS